ncbi:MAG: hypothetical protein ABWW66_04775 [Archaeoglobaceae archaeon]
MIYAYYDGMFKGNAKEAIEELKKLFEFMENSGVEEVAYERSETALFAVSKPILALVIAESLEEARVQLRKLLRELGYLKESDLETAFRIAEEIDRLPIEEVVRRFGK